MSDAPLRIALLGALPRGGERLRRWLLQASDEAATAAPVFCNDPADADAVLVACETPADAARIAALRQRLPDLPMVAVPLGSSKGRAEAGAAGLKAGADDLFDLASARRASAFALLCRLRARVAANRRFAAERAEAEHFLEAFCHSVAHDLRGPLHVVRGFGEALVAGEVGAVDDTARQYLQRMLAKTGRMEALIEALLRLARVSRGTLDRARFDIVALAREELEAVRARHPGRQVAFTVGAGCEVRADRRLLAIALECLIDNALKFSPPDAPARLRVEANRTAEGVVCTLRDWGCGLPGPWPDPSFGRPQRLHAGPEPISGNGLGLMTAARILRRHGGRLQVLPASGGGVEARFSFDA